MSCSSVCQPPISPQVSFFLFSRNRLVLTNRFSLRSLKFVALDWRCSRMASFASQNKILITAALQIEALQNNPIVFRIPTISRIWVYPPALRATSDRDSALRASRDGGLRASNSISNSLRSALEKNECVWVLVNPRHLFCLLLNLVFSLYFLFLQLSSISCFAIPVSRGNGFESRWSLRIFSGIYL